MKVKKLLAVILTLLILASIPPALAAESQEQTAASHNPVVRMLVKLSGKDIDTVKTALENNKGNRAAALQALGVEQQALQQAMQQAKARQEQRKLKVGVLAKLSGKSAKDTANLIQDKQGKTEDVLTSLNIEPAAFQDALRKAKVNQAFRQEAIRGLAKLSGKKPQDIIKALQNHQGSLEQTALSLGIDAKTWNSLKQKIKSRQEEQHTRLSLLTKLSGKTSQQVKDLLQGHKGKLKEALTELAIDPKTFHKAFNQRKEQAIILNVKVGVLRKLSGKKAPQVAEALRTNKGDLQAALQSLGLKVITN